MYVTVTKTHNLVQDLGDMLAAGKNPKVYFSLLESKGQITVLNEALKVIDLKPEGVLFEDSLLSLRAENIRERIKSVSENCSYPVFSLDDIRQEENAVIVVNNSVNYFYLISNFFEKKKIKCTLIHYQDIKNSAIVNGKVRVINRIGYLNSWPWFMDIINKDMPQDKREGFNLNAVVGSVVSNGDYYYYSDIDSEYSHFKDGFRSVSGYTPSLENTEKHTVTLLGDSRFVNAYAPTELTMASYLQEQLMNFHLNFEVKNFSVKANRVQNEAAMLKSLSLKAGDIVICTCPVLGQYETFKVASVEMRTKIKLRMMRDMTEYCNEKNVKLMFVYLPEIHEIPNLTSLEQFIADSYGKKYAPTNYAELMKQRCMAHGISLVDLTSELIHTKRTSLFIDYSHFSPEGSKYIAEMLAGYIRSYASVNSWLDTEQVKTLTEQGYAGHKHYVTEARFKGITAYVTKLQEIANGKPDNCGAIVMNCNPFTLGHRYLIEQAASQIEYLYILAVEEDRSVFKFKDRFEMIRQGVADIPNVEVIPSGKFVISSLTFPEYFEKSKKPDMTVDTSSDIELFCEYIAPALNIKTRFVGEEPLDMVTNQYNTCMKEKLPKYGLNIIEIPRKEFNDAPISASRVRKLLEEKKYEDVKEIVPQTTYDYLINVLGY